MLGVQDASRIDALALGVERATQANAEAEDLMQGVEVSVNVVRGTRAEGQL